MPNGRLQDLWEIEYGGLSATELDAWAKRIESGFNYQAWGGALSDAVGRGEITATQAKQIATRLSQRMQTRGVETQFGPLREQALEKRQREEEKARRQVTRREPKVPPLTPASQMYYPFIEGLDTPAMQSYFKYQFPQIFAEFGGERAMRGAEETRLKAKKTLEAYGNIKGRAEAGLKETLARYQGMYRPPEGTTAIGEAREAVGKAGAKVQSASDRYREIMAQHPFQTFLEKYPFMEKYMKMAPRERGEFPRIRRPTRWLGF